MVLVRVGHERLDNLFHWGYIVPVYDLRCPECGMAEWDVVQASDAILPCSFCGEAMEKIWGSSPAVHIFQSGHFEHAADENGKTPYFDSRQKYKAYLKEHGMYSEYADGY